MLVDGQQTSEAAGEDVNDTFDSGDYTKGAEYEDTLIADAGESQDEDEGEEGQGTKEVSDEADEIESFDSQVDLLDEKEATPKKEDEKDGEEKSDKSDEEDKTGDEKSEDKSDSKDDASDDAGDDAEEVRVVKAFSDGKQYEIPENAEIRTKVAGKWEKPTLRDLKDNYAGKVAYDRKFTDISTREKDFGAKEEQYNSEISTIKEHFTNIRQLTTAAIAGDADPNSSMNYLLDLMGINTVDYNKAAFNNMAEEFDLYSQLTESERDAHWTKKENAYLVKQQESLATKQTESKTQADYSQKVSDLREAHSISEDDYVSAEQDLKADNLDTSPEEVVKAAKLKPLLSQADNLIEPYLDQLSDTQADALSVDIATTMFRSPELTVNQVKKLLAEQYEVEEIVSKIEKKVGSEGGGTVPKYDPSKDSGHLESFDDLD